MNTRSRLVFRLVVPTGVANTTSTIYVTTRGFRTASSDTPASTYIQERVAKAGGFSRSLYSGGTLGGVIKPNYGVLVLNNEDGGLDTIATYAGGGGTVTCWWGEDGAAFPAVYTQVYQATIASVLVDMATVTIRQQDRMEALSRPIVTATFAGSGGIEGTDVAARKKPLVFGTPGLVPLVLLDKASQVYYVQANATDSDTARGLSEFGQVFEGGVPIDRASSNYPFKDYLFMAVHAPGPGEFRMWTGYDTRFASQAAANTYTKGPILVRLGGVPVGELRFGAVGRLQNTSGSSPREWRFSDLCNRAGLNDVESDTIAIMQGVRADFTVGNRYTEADQTYLQVMTDRCQALLGACGFNRLDEFFCLTLLDPEDGADSSVYTFTADNAAGFTRLPVPGMERPVWQVNVKAGRAWPCTVFSGASAEMQDLLTREGHYVSFRGYSSNTRKKYPNAISVDLEIDGHDFPDVPSQRAFVDRFGALFGTRRDLMQLRCLDFSATTLTLELHDKVTLTLDRLGYDAGELMRIVGIELDLDAQQIKFMLWGTNTGFSGWATTGGAFPADAGEPGGSWGSEDPPPDVVDQTTVQLGLNDLMGNFTGLLVGGPIVEPLPADADSNAAAMGDFTGGIYGAAAAPDTAELLLHFDGSFTDASSAARSITNNSAATSTDHPAWGSAALEGNGAGYLQTTDDGAFDFGNGVFSIDFWLYIETAASLATDNIIAAKWSAGSQSWFINLYGSLERISLGSRRSGTNFFDTISGVLPRDTLMHVAVWRHSISAGVSCAIDGVIVGSSTGAMSFDTSADDLTIGATTAGGAPLPAGVHVDELRICVGTIDYFTSDFTPPAGPY